MGIYPLGGTCWQSIPLCIRSLSSRPILGRFVASCVLVEFTDEGIYILLSVASPLERSWQGQWCYYVNNPIEKQCTDVVVSTNSFRKGLLGCWSLWLCFLYEKVHLPILRRQEVYSTVMSVCELTNLWVHNCFALKTAKLCKKLLEFGIGFILMRTCNGALVSNS